MNILGTVAAIWFAASIIIAGGYALIRSATRTDADRQREDTADLEAVMQATKERAEDELLNSLIREAFRQAQEQRGYVAHGIEQVEAYLKAGA